jgi:hypothetical protein
MTSIGDLYRAQRAAQSGSAMYRVQPAAPPAPAPYERAAYGGLAGYMAEREPVEDKRSPEAIRRATVVSAWGIAAQRAADEVSEEDWKAHRAAQDASGVDRGLIGKDARQAYQAQLAANRFGRIQANGHLANESSPGQPGVRRVYAAQIRQEEQRGHLAALRSTGEGWR